VIARPSEESESDDAAMDELSKIMLPENNPSVNSLRLEMLLNRRVKECEASGDAKKMASTLEQLLLVQPRSFPEGGMRDEMRVLQKLCNCYMTLEESRLARKNLERLRVLTLESYDGLNSDDMVADRVAEVVALDTDIGISSANLGENGLAFETFLSIQTEIFEIDPEEGFAISLANLGVLGQREMLREAHEMFRSIHGEGHPFTKLTARNLGLEPVAATSPRP